MLTPLPAGLKWSHPAAVIATWLGAGRLPKAPGTWGSLAALPFAWMIQTGAGSGALLAAAGVMFVAGLWASGVYAAHDRDNDPGPVVVDEVAGQWLVLAFADANVIVYLLGFALFRVFDIAKPWPVSWAERRFKGAVGIMMDDVVAALYAGPILFAVDRWIMV